MPDLPQPTRSSPTDATELGLRDLEDQARTYAEASMSTATRRAYDAAWRGFCAWCRERGVCPWPAAPGTVAAYLTDRAAQVRPSTLTQHLVAIGHAHRVAQKDDPTLDARVRAILRGIRRTHGSPPQGKDPLLVGDLVSMGVDPRVSRGDAGRLGSRFY
jgi:hypothetical protein